MPQGFIDLRLGNEHRDEGFWPSFTDIMTVIVLVFLLAMLTLLVKNMDLVHQLQDSLAAERSAAEQAYSTTNINTELNMRLKRLEEASSMLRLRLMNLGEEHSRAISQLKKSEQDNMQLKSQLSGATRGLDTALSEKANLEKRQVELVAELEQRLQALNLQEQQNRESQAEIAKFKSSGITQLERLKLLELQHVDLQTKYNKLIRPARSQLGKEVVFVRYHREGGKLHIGIKRPTDAAYQATDSTALHKRLAQLQKKHGKNLYVRIVFPDESGLSYTEAWSLTDSLLSQYDYYYQE
ncbi:hypothetical protein F3F96_04935 [Mariprofundus sp. NF]|uniref:hypothetical protein n=1 Tax=Mariprofundus sp. NF TaxID=2608716 RepID=UPI00159F8DF4|nr:hypothetical protein [Mariprofundus sp. NF]NWF38473.1 hypothetical protein [Mariprofundus sp. NF]